ncbi:hypothetical protein LTR62_004842 [Meristemomyces frigidus]|uniref:Uncharacterized protein n=1 Tax=Meristemomyces frigidus TaxID=1508187 RepID=A0AAN7YNV3_9PEZI|nr:hypothetical protein LTR62_004842 [Meristemomyces frigidus]
MPLTRHTPRSSAAASIASPAVQDTTGMSDRAKRMLKQLTTDARFEDKAEKPSLDPTNVYHYRGAVYERKGDEPIEWLEEESRGKRRSGGDAHTERVEGSRKRRLSQGDDENGAGGKKARPSEPTPVSEVKRRKVKGDKPARDINTAARPPAEKRTTTKDLTSTTTKKRPMPSTNPPPPERKRKRQDDQADFFIPLSKRRLPPPAPALTRAKPKPTHKAATPASPPTFTLATPHEPKSCSQARADAIASGINLSPLRNETDALWLSPRPRLARDMSALMREVARLNGIIKDSTRALTDLKACRAKAQHPETSRADSVVLPSSPAFKTADNVVEAEAEVEGGISEDRAEEVLFGGRMAGETFKKRDERFGVERGVLEGFFQT